MSAASTREVATPLVQMEALEVHFPIRRGFLRRQVGAVHAVDGVDLDILRGESLGLVGESGSGKSTLGRAVLGLVKATAGSVRFDGHDLADVRGRELKELRRDMQMVFQDPVGSLSPRMTVRDIISEGLAIHRLHTGKAREPRVRKALEWVGLPAEAMHRYPHQFSGGQRQRIAIARALVFEPRFIVADEPVSALDVSIQSQILNLMADLRRELGLTYLFIAHDLPVVGYIADRIGVMYLGKVVEVGAGRELLEAPLHPYTQALLSAAPKVDATARRSRVLLKGDIPSPIQPPSGCRFHTRCPIAQALCADVAPALAPAGDRRHVACHFPGAPVAPAGSGTEA